MKDGKGAAAVSAYFARALQAILNFCATIMRLLAQAGIASLTNLWTCWVTIFPKFMTKKMARNKRHEKRKKIPAIVVNDWVLDIDPEMYSSKKTKNPGIGSCAGFTFLFVCFLFAFCLLLSFFNFTLRLFFVFVYLLAEKFRARRWTGTLRSIGWTINRWHVLTKNC